VFYHKKNFMCYKVITEIFRSKPLPVMDRQTTRQYHIRGSTQPKHNIDFCSCTLSLSIYVANSKYYEHLKKIGRIYFKIDKL
jgi:hypothetical protein